VNLPSLLIDDSIRITVSLETIKTTIVVVIEAEIVTITIITTIIATWTPISPAIVIVIRIP
jgi:hypothetical protein